jgi:hypothetical protein
MMSLCSTIFNAAALLRDVMRINPFWLWGEILLQRLGSPVIWVARLGLDVKVGIKKETSIIDIVGDKNPLSWGIPPSIVEMLLNASPIFLRSCWS